MRRMITFDCNGDLLAGTLDEADGSTGLLIVSGGNEIRSGAHSGQAEMAAKFAALGHPVFRYDRRGIGDSEGSNGGFETTADDLAAALAAFRAEAPQVKRITAFGNCDAATALALFHADLPVDVLVLANPWVIETASDENNNAPTPPSAAAIRSRYWARLKNPRSLIDLFTGKIDLKKLASGLAKAAAKEEMSGLALRLGSTLEASSLPVHILIAERDTTALAFMGAWRGEAYAKLRARSNIKLSAIDTPSHSFADEESKAWLYGQISTALAKVGSEGGT